MSIERAKRFDQALAKEVETKSLDFKVRDLLVLKTVLMNKVALECTKQSHKVEIIKEKQTSSKNCCKIGHRTKDSSKHILNINKNVFLSNRKFA